MKTELRLAPHSVLAGEHVIELWYDGQFIGQVTGADGPGVRIITKHVIGEGEPTEQDGVVILEHCIFPGLLNG